jgi:hypothetical protein
LNSPIPFVALLPIRAGSLYLVTLVSKTIVAY